MPLNPNRHSKRITRAVILAAVLTSGLTACGLAWELNQMHEGIFYWPRGAVAPEGLDEITGESTPDEVVQVLGSRYEHYPKQLAGEEDLIPVSDGFIYKEDGAAKYIEVWYTFGTEDFSRKVDFVRYGYDRFLGIE